MSLIKSKPTSPGRRFRVKIQNPTYTKASLMLVLLPNPIKAVEEIIMEELRQGILVVDIRENTE